MPASDRPVLILGGTAEAVKLAAALVALGNRTISSLAGRTSNPAKIEGEVRTGGFGGADGLADYLRKENIALLVDATHPFATQISDNALAAVEATGIPFARLERPDWRRKPGDNWISVATLEEAVSAVPSKARILLALGRQHIAPFSKRRDVFFVVRMIDPPETPLDLFDFELELSKPGKKDEEIAFLTRKQLTHIICRNSGGSASYAKISAARELGLPVVMIERPHRPGTHALPDMESVVHFVVETLG